MLDNEIVPDNKELEEKILEKDMSKTNWSLKDTLPSLIYWPLLIAQISMVFF